MKIYFASLTDYNSGILHGVWVDPEDKDADDIQEEINEMLKASPAAKKDPYLIAEEWAIHDHEGFPRCIGEYANLEDIMEYVEACERIDKAAVKAYVEYHGDFSVADKAAEAYRFGPQDNMREVGMEMYEQAHGEIPEGLIIFVDWEAYAERSDISQEYITVGSHSDGFYAFTSREV